MWIRGGRNLTTSIHGDEEDKAAGKQKKEDGSGGQLTPVVMSMELGMEI
jgi:hypothetical protein